MTLEEHHVAFRIAEKVKTSKPGKHVANMEFDGFPHNPDLCVVQCLNVYLTRTKDHRGSSKRLFYTFGKPYRPASRSTITRWLRNVLEAAGINMTIFTPYSIRHSSMSSVSDRVPMETILRTGGWSRETTFSRFYNKPVVASCAVQHAILENYKKK